MTNPLDGNTTQTTEEMPPAPPAPPLITKIDWKIVGMTGYNNSKINILIGDDESLQMNKAEFKQKIVALRLNKTFETAKDFIEWKNSLFIEAEKIEIDKKTEEESKPSVMPDCQPVGLTKRGVLILSDTAGIKHECTKTLLNIETIQTIFGGNFTCKDHFDTWLVTIKIAAKKNQNIRDKEKEIDDKREKDKVIEEFRRFQILSSTNEIFDKKENIFYSKSHFNTKFLKTLGKFTPLGNGAFDIKNKPFVLAQLYSKQFDYGIYRADRKTGESIMFEGKPHMNTHTPSKLLPHSKSFLPEAFDSIIEQVEREFIDPYIKIFPDFSLALAYMARIILRPAEKVNWFIHMASEGEGSGKGVFAMIFRECLGRQNVVSDNGNSLSGEFNSHLFDKELYILNEGKINSKDAAHNVFKELITDTQFSYHKKGNDRVTRECLLNVLYLSNDSMSYPITSADRRCTLLISAFSAMEDRDAAGFGKEFWDNFIDVWLKGKNGFAKILWYIHNHYKESHYFDEHAFTCRENIKTGAWSEVIDENKPEWQLEFDKAIDGKATYGCVEPFLSFTHIKAVIRRFETKKDGEITDKAIRSYIRRKGYKIPNCLNKPKLPRWKHEMFKGVKPCPTDNIVYVQATHSLMHAEKGSPEFIKIWKQTNSPVIANNGMTRYEDKNGY